MNIIQRTYRKFIMRRALLILDKEKIFYKEQGSTASFTHRAVISHIAKHGKY